jgi:hypothetical protein
MTTESAKGSRDEAIRVLIGAAEILTMSAPPLIEFPRGSALLIVPESEFTSVAPVTGHYRGRFFVQFTRHEVEATLPLRPGADVRNGNHRVVLDSVLESAGRMDLWLRVSDATSSFDRLPRAERAYYIRNRRIGKAIEAREDEVAVSPLPRMMGGFSASRTIWGFWAGGIALRLPPWAGQRTDDLDETWLRDADLVIVKSTREGGVERTLDLDGFPLEATPPSETRIKP